MSPGQATDMMREAILLILVLGAPVLLTGLIVGLIVSILQAVTQVQEMTLSLVPKIIAMLLALLITGPWILQRLVEFSRRAFG